VITSAEVLSISNYEISKICRNKVKKVKCIKKLKLNRYRLNNGKPIEVQVIPYIK